MNAQTSVVPVSKTSSTVANQVFRRSSRFSSDVLAFVVIAGCHAPLLLAHFRRLWLYEQYHYIPFVFAAFGYFVWQRWDRAGVVHSNFSARTSLTLLVLSLATLAISLVVWSSWLAAVAAILTTGGAILHFGGRRAATELLGAWLLLWFMIPLPFRWDVELIFELQTLASRAASCVLDFVHVDHLLAGHILEIPRRQFLVEEACSGIHSLFALMAFAAIMMIGMRRSWGHSVPLLISAVFWATTINVMRVTSVVALFVWFGFDVATGWKHETLGMLLFVFALVLLFSTDRLLLFFSERPREVPDDSRRDGYYAYYEDAAHVGSECVPDNGMASRSEDPPVLENAASAAPDTWNPNKTNRMVVILAGLFGLVGLGQLAGMAIRLDGLQVVGEAHRRLDDAFHEDTLPTQIGDWNRVKFRNEKRGMTNSLGASFASWSYQTENVESTFMVNYPFLGWHHLPACYVAQGWQIESQTMTTVAGETMPEAEVWQLELVRPSGARMHVRFSQFDANGQPVRPADWHLHSIRKLLRHNPLGQLNAVSSDASTYQVVMQAIPLQQSSPPSADELAEGFILVQGLLAKRISQRLHDD